MSQMNQWEKELSISIDDIRPEYVGKGQWEKELSISIDDFRPEYVGRGQWSSIHTLAAKAKNLDQRKSAVWSIRTIINNLRCNICLEHATKYMKEHPIEEVMYDPLLFFQWTYYFHKAANSFAGKGSPSFEEVRQFYYENNERCTKSCGGKENEENNFIE
jgi:hypothetical protein